MGIYTQLRYSNWKSSGFVDEIEIMATRRVRQNETAYGSEDGFPELQGIQVFFGTNVNGARVKPDYF